MAFSSENRYDPCMNVKVADSGTTLRPGQWSETRMFSGTPGHTYVAAGGERLVLWDSALEVWDVATGRRHRAIERQPSRYFRRPVGVSTDARLVVLGNYRGQLELWDTDAGTRGPVGRWQTGSSVDQMAVTPDGRRVFGGGTHTLGELATVMMWEPAKPHGPRTLGDHESTADWEWLDPLGSHSTHHTIHVAVTPDGRRGISCVAGLDQADAVLKIWDLDSGRCQHAVGDDLGLCAVAATPDSRRAVTGTQKGELKVWDLESGTCVRTMADLSGAVKAVALSADGRRVAASAESTGIWDLETGRCLATLDAKLSSMALTADGKQLVGRGWHGVQVWREGTNTN